MRWVANPSETSAMIFIDRKLVLPIKPVPKALALHIGHHVEQERVRLARIEERQDVRVLEIRRGLDLS